MEAQNDDDLSVEAQNDDYSSMQGIEIAEDGSILHTDLVKVDSIQSQAEELITDFLQSGAINVDLCVTNMCSLSEELLKIIRIGSLRSLWNLLCKLKTENTLLPPIEVTIRKDDLKLDINDLYEYVTPQCIVIMNELKTVDQQNNIRKAMITFLTMVNHFSISMTDLDHRLLTLISLIDPTTPYINTETETESISAYNQIKLVKDIALPLARHFHLKRGNEKHFLDFGRLQRRVCLLLHDNQLIKLSPRCQARYNIIKTLAELPEPNNERFRNIVAQMEDLMQESKEYNSVCRLKCCKFYIMYKRFKTDGYCINNFKCKRIKKFVVDVSQYYCEVCENLQYFNSNTFRLQIVIDAAQHEMLEQLI